MRVAGRAHTQNGTAKVKARPGQTVGRLLILIQGASPNSWVCETITGGYYESEKGPCSLSPACRIELFRWGMFRAWQQGETLLLQGRT